MKVHVGADVNSGLVHTVSVTPANVSDINQLPHQVREDDRAVFGDKGYENKGYDRDEGKNCTYPPQTVVLQQKILAPAAPG